jgi:hypothetical protein
MSEKFTQGEWFVEDWQGVTNVDHDYSIIAGTGEYIAHIENCNLGEQEANANLIRTAPEMYALLSIILSPTAMMSQQFRGEGLRTAIENVLKKARGEE